MLTRDARRPLPVRLISGQEMFALDDLAKLFDLTSREDALAGGLTISTKTQTITLTAGQALASAAGRVVSLPAPPVKDGGRWFLPIDFVPRALSPALGTRLELRRPSRLIVAGDLRVPRITARLEPAGVNTRLTFEILPATPHTVVQEGARILLRFDADALDATLPASPVPDVVKAVHVAESPLTIAIELGPRFASFKSADAAGERGAGRVVTVGLGRGSRLMRNRARPIADQRTDRRPGERDSQQQRYETHGTILSQAAGSHMRTWHQNRTGTRSDSRSST